MIDTLQADDPEALEPDFVEDVTLDSVDPELGAEEAPAEQKKVSFDDGQQAWVNDKIGDMTRETHTERRRADALQNQLDEIERNKPQEQRPHIPPIPDAYDDNVDELHRIRDQAIADQASFDGRQAFVQEQQRSAQQVQQNETMQSLRTDVNEYKARGKSFGISDDDMNTAANALNTGGVSQETQHYIMKDTSGALITDFLSKNPVEMNNIRNMSQMAQAAYIESTIKPKASATRKPTSAPNPANILKGGGSPNKERGPKGAKFE